MTWEQIYDLLGIRDFIYFISSPGIQEAIFPIKLVFIAFSVFFLVAVFYFYLNSSYLQYHFVEDVFEFFLWEPYGLRQINRRWQKIVKKTENGGENEYKLAIVEADDFLHETLENRGYRGETFSEMVADAGPKMPSGVKEILSAHEIRNYIVYNPDYKLDLKTAKEVLDRYEKAIKSI